MSATRAPAFVVVKMFETIRPYSRPRVFIHVRNAMTRIATSWATDSEKAYPLDMCSGGIR